jgi:hypothetical protein
MQSVSISSRRAAAFTPFGGHAALDKNQAQ